MMITGDPSVQGAGSAGRRELEQHDPSRVSQNASHFLQGPFLISHVMECDDRRDPVEGAVRKWNLLCLALHESNRRPELSSLGDFPPVRLEDDHLVATHRKSFCRGARATADIEQTRPRDRSNELVQL